MSFNQYGVKSKQLETPVEMASRHVAQADIGCQRQTDLIERMRAKGLDTTAAEDLSMLFQQCLKLSYAHLRRLIGECDSMRTNREEHPQ